MVALDMNKVDTMERLRRLREVMKKHKVDVYSMQMKIFFTTR